MDNRSFARIAHSAQAKQPRKPIFDPAENGDETMSDALLLQIRHLVENNMLEDIRVDDLPKKVFQSKAQIFRKIKALTGQSPSRFICRIRLEKAMELLKTTSQKISEIAMEVGFSDTKYFFRVFRREFGIPPSSVRQNDI